MGGLIGVMCLYQAWVWTKPLRGEHFVLLLNSGFSVFGILAVGALLLALSFGSFFYTPDEYKEKPPPPPPPPNPAVRWGTDFREEVTELVEKDVFFLHIKNAKATGGALTLELNERLTTTLMEASCERRGGFAEATFRMWQDLGIRDPDASFTFIDDSGHVLVTARVDVRLQNPYRSDPLIYECGDGS